jgi:vacuolar-type H+-ATPase subunit E/Vma4
METRHKDEVAQLRGAHQSELDHVKTDTQKRIENIQEESNVKLNQKDVQYQKEIESMRTLYNRRIADAKREGE